MQRMTRPRGMIGLQGEPNALPSLERLGGLDLSFSGTSFMTHTFKCPLFITVLDYLCLYVQHDERGSAGQGGRRYDRQASNYGGQRDQKERLVDRDEQKADKHSLQGMVEPAQQQNDGDSTWKHDRFLQLDEEAPIAKRRPPFQVMMSREQESADAPSVTAPDSRTRNPDQPGPTSAMREERRNYHMQGFRNHRPFVRPDDRSFRRGFPDHRSDGQRHGYDSRGRFAGRGGMDRDRFNNPYGGRSNLYQATGDEEEKWKHDLYDQTNRSPPPKTEEEQIAKVEALLEL
ncbi:uncharacterized protein LOC133916697 isoform X2 [Phragmites australis]|uniref:uncharacterized protein LOC133916697 isoform X2 n=1 Tax=Phragmites australis TaxID=29695 RepID=UPI002D76A3F9|nr:uncharacterized protein LOC133916697 isoform X2 [Phragmites australis]